MKRMWCGIVLFAYLFIGSISQLAAQTDLPQPITAENVDQIKALAKFPILDSQDSDLRWSPDGRVIAVASAHGGRTYDLSQVTDKPNAIFGSGIHTQCVDYVPDRSVIATCSSASSTVWLWDRHTGKKLATLANGPYNLEYARFSANGRILAVLSVGNGVYLWGVNGGQEAIVPANALKMKRLGQINLDAASINMAISPDSSSLAMVSNDNTLRIWNLASLKLTTEQAFEDKLSALAYSPDGQWIALGGYAKDAGFVRLVNVADPTLTREFKPDSKLDIIDDLNFSADGKLLVSGQNDGKFTLWDVNRGEALRTIKAAFRITYRIAFNRDATLIATSNFDDGTQIWGLPDSLAHIPTPSLSISSQAVVKPGKEGVLNMRAEAGTQADRILQLKANTIVTLMDGPTDADGMKWWKVRNADGVEGWVAESVNGEQTLIPDY